MRVTDGVWVGALALADLLGGEEGGTLARPRIADHDVVGDAAEGAIRPSELVVQQAAVGSLGRQAAPNEHLFGRDLVGAVIDSAEMVRRELFAVRKSPALRVVRITDGVALRVGDGARIGVRVIL